jgi:hypothetical protein
MPGSKCRRPGNTFPGVGNSGRAIPGMRFRWENALEMRACGGLVMPCLACRLSLPISGWKQLAARAI